MLRRGDLDALRQEAPQTPASPAHDQRQRPCMECRKPFTRNSLKPSILLKQLIEAAAERGDDLRPFSCCICMEVMEQPVTLQCGHTGCRKCLSSVKTVDEIFEEQMAEYAEHIDMRQQAQRNGTGD